MSTYAFLVSVSTPDGRVNAVVAMGDESEGWQRVASELARLLPLLGDRHGEPNDTITWTVRCFDELGRPMDSSERDTLTLDVPNHLDPGPTALRIGTFVHAYLVGLGFPDTDVTAYGLHLPPKENP